MDELHLAAAIANQYRLERPLGSGGMAMVYLARDLKHDREVALKVLRPELAAVLGAERFLTEIRITAQLDHPHILTLIDSGAADGFLYYVLPYVRGESLRAWLDRERRFGLEASLAIVRQVASALDYAHRRGVVHRDVKPENILIQEGEAMLTDFGIALAVREAAGPRLTATGVSLGTPQYMSPEQATGDRDVDARTDVYSLAAVLFEMLAGEPPVQGPTVQAMIAKLLTEQPARLRSLSDTVPESVDNAVATALARAPSDRYASAAQFAAALTAGEERARLDAVGHRRRIRFGPVALAAATIATLGVAVGLMLGPGRRTPFVALRDRRQLTFTGNVRLAALSPDAHNLAMLLSDCTQRGCAYGIAIQDVAEPARRRVVDGAKAIYGAQWSGDGRYLLFTGRIEDRFGSFVVPVQGGRPRLVSPWTAGFYAKGDSLLILRDASDTLVLVATRDGVERDSLVPDVSGTLTAVQAVPDSPWFVAVVRRGPAVEVLTVDRQGRVGDRFELPRAAMHSRISADALWYAPGNNWKTRIVRVPLDPRRGRFGTRHDTVYTGTFWGFDVTRDGSRIVFDEGASEYSAWALPFPDALGGSSASQPPLRRSSAEFRANLSPDGGTVLLERGPGPWFDPATAYTYTLIPFDDGPEVPLPLSGPSKAVWKDSATLAVAEIRPGGTRFSLVDVRTGRSRAALQVADSAIWEFTALPGGGWAWLRPGAGIGFQRSGEPQPRFLKQPDWYSALFTLAASTDGNALLVAGLDAATNDSMRVEWISLTGGGSIPWVTEPAEIGYLTPLSDGSFLLARWEGQQAATLERLRGPGRVERLGTVPRPLSTFSASADLRRAVISAYDYRGDIYMSRVVGR